MPTARPTIPSSERLVSNTRPIPYLSCSPRVAPCTPPFGPTSSPNTTMRGLSASSVSSVRRIAVSMLMRAPSGCARSLEGANPQPSASSPPGGATPPPLGLAQALGHEQLLESRERIAGALRFEQLGRFVGLRILAGVPRQERHGEPQQHRRPRGAHLRHGARGELAGRTRVAAVAFEDREAAEG